MLTWPWVGCTSPARMRSSVDLPQPEGPSTAMNSWRPMSKLALSSATPSLPSEEVKTWLTRSKLMLGRGVAGRTAAFMASLAQAGVDGAGRVEGINLHALRLGDPFPGGGQTLGVEARAFGIADLVLHQRHRGGELLFGLLLVDFGNPLFQRGRRCSRVGDGVLLCLPVGLDELLRDLRIALYEALRRYQRQ